MTRMIVIHIFSGLIVGASDLNDTGDYSSGGLTPLSNEYSERHVSLAVVRALPQQRICSYDLSIAAPGCTNRRQQVWQH